VAGHIYDVAGHNADVAGNIDDVAGNIDDVALQRGVPRRGGRGGAVGNQHPQGKAVQVDSSKTCVDTSARLWFQRLKAQYADPLSNVAIS